MYTVAKAPSRIVQKSRQGLSQQKIEHADFDELIIPTDPQNVKLVFNKDILYNNHNNNNIKNFKNGHNSNGYSNTMSSKSAKNSSALDQSSPESNRHQLMTPSGYRRYNARNSQEKLSPEEEDLVNYISSKWARTKREIEEADSKMTTVAQAAAQTPRQKVVYYKETEPLPILRNFEPFDLEAWWGKRLYQNLTKAN